MQFGPHRYVELHYLEISNGGNYKLRWEAKAANGLGKLQGENI